MRNDRGDGLEEVVMNALTVIPQDNAAIFRASTDAAGLCREIVLKTAKRIEGRQYVCVEGWQAIAIAHGCTASAGGVERIDGGVRATGEIRRMSDGVIIATAEGFVGEDEPVWFGGIARGKTYHRRPDYAIRAMAQTRSISRACRSAFAHVVVMIDNNLSTTPAEEMGAIEADYVEHEPSPPPRAATNASRAPKQTPPVAPEPNGNGNGERLSAEQWTEKFIAGLATLTTLGELEQTQVRFKAKLESLREANPALADKAFNAVLGRKGEIELDDEIPW